MGQVHAGIETGPCEGFVIGADDRKNLVKKDSRNKKLIRKLVNARDISRYHAGSGPANYLFLFPSGWTKMHTGVSEKSLAMAQAKVSPPREAPEKIISAHGNPGRQGSLVGDCR